MKKSKSSKKPLKKGVKKTKANPIKKKKGKASENLQNVYLGLGSNVGDREEYIEQAVFLLGKIKEIEVIKRSSNQESEAEGVKDQPSFINAALQIKTELSPHKLLEEIHTIESALGREREIEWGPRTIDIDILLYGNKVISEDDIQIPHPSMHERLFVLKPLKEIAPNLMHPVLEKNIEDLYEERKNEAVEKYDDELPGFKEIKRGGGYDDFERW
ncbi:MAG: 2-amino-4-hydroxy-6-hydroxymethyldihydropteridine pyrophosphokinase [Candidatus Saganbacteria bacterium]|uniref:2-amino-4-hydroxy-6-hydroxymethyldihydropteridine diphosphokinase n=1 Tax=Candidatus Saganbacteria bacterium TaxID=2575572 RepID=A0A833L0A8_UNCSA|nr:MAG: 2-amino-4-hydroxy-6-hydroxymethyldihydropteridine pyrophosphokinase [Candidatus Saganbacteria bacterium]